MIKTFGDFETNGLPTKSYTTGNGRYVAPVMPSPESFAYIQTTENLTEIVKAEVLYFYNPSVIEHKMDAEAIHGLTERFLSNYREDFIPNTRKLFKVFFKGNLIGHNFKGFDMKVGRAFLESMGYGIDVPINSIEDTMFGTSSYFSKIYTQREGKTVRNKRLKLQVMCKEFGIQDKFIRVMHNKIFKFEPDQDWHNASWDVVATYLCYRKAKSMKIM